MNSATHTIRLRHPWEKTRLVDDSALQQSTAVQQSPAVPTIRVNVPEPMENLSEHTAIYQRRFNRPTSLTPQCIVRLEIQSWQGELTSLCINGVAVPGESAPLLIDITEHLKARNLIVIQLRPLNDSAVRLSGAINLVIQTHDDASA